MNIDAAQGGIPVSKKFLWFLVMVVFLSMQSVGRMEDTSLVFGADTRQTTGAAEQGNAEMQTPKPATADSEVSVTAAPTVLHEEPAVPVYGMIRVASTTPLTGRFFPGMAGQTVSDMDVCSLLHACNLVRWDGNTGKFVPDEAVVSGIVCAEDQDGNHSYLVALHDDLYYSDGSRITAWDYAFSYLLRLMPATESTGMPGKIPHCLKGAGEYRNATRFYLSGVSVVDEYQLMITIDHTYLPDFHEIGLLDCYPVPMDTIAPGYTIRDDGLGVYLTGPQETDPVQTLPEGLLGETLLDSASGYLFHPAKVSGPYMLEQFDGTTAVLSWNPYFKGDVHGRIPQVQKLTYACIRNEDVIRAIREGKTDIVCRLTRADVLDPLLQDRGAGYTMASYPRQGLGMISLNTERYALQSPDVRKALAMCLDKDAVVTGTVGYYGLRADGYYGIGQWMYSMLNGRGASYLPIPDGNATREEQDAYLQESNAWKQLTLDELVAYSLDIETARKLLIRDGWTRNADGSMYAETGEMDAGVPPVRWKEADGRLIPLELTLICPEGNRIADTLKSAWVPNLNRVGIRLTVQEVPMPVLVQEYIRDTEPGTMPRDEDMICLAVNFDPPYDPEHDFVTGPDGRITWNHTCLEDPELYQLACSMRATQAGDMLAYCQKWVAYQKRLSELEPVIPLYSNMYFDVCAEKVQGYDPVHTSSFAERILGVTVTE